MRKCMNILVAVTLVFCLVSCSSFGDMNHSIDEGVARFVDGREEIDYTPLDTNEVLESLIEDFSGSLLRPSGKEMDENDYANLYDDIHDETEPTIGNDPSKQQEPDKNIVSNNKELMALLHDALDKTETYLEFSTSGNYQYNGYEMEYLYRELQRIDPIDVCALDSWSFGCNNGVWLVELNYALPVDKLKQIKKDTPDLLKKAVSKIDAEGKSEYEILLAVNSYICEQSVYPDKEPYSATSHMAYSVFTDHDVVCEGYACAAKLMLSELGVECDIEVGDCLNGEGHAWNLVKLDSQWYQLDICWNDCEGSTNYLAVTDDYMRKSRVWNYDNYPSTPKDPYKG